MAQPMIKGTRTNKSYQRDFRMRIRVKRKEEEKGKEEEGRLWREMCFEEREQWSMDARAGKVWDAKKNKMKNGTEKNIKGGISVGRS